MNAQQQEAPEPVRYTRRQWFIYDAVMEGTPMFLAMEAVASTAIEHPEWDMEEPLTWLEWMTRPGR